MPPQSPAPGPDAAKAIRNELHRAEALIAQGRSRDGETIIENLLKAYPGYFAARTAFAGVRFRDGRQAEALALLEGALRLDPENPRLLVRIGQLEKALGFVASAATRFRHAIGIDPANLDAVWELAQVELQDDDLEPAIARLKALAPVFGSSSVETMLGDALEKIGRPDDAMAVYLRQFLSAGTAAKDRSNAAFRLCSLPATLPSDELQSYLATQVAPEDALAAGFARAQLLMRGNDHTAAWEVLAAANRARWAEVGPAALAQERSHARVLHYCETSALAPSADVAPAGHTTPILIVGASRSGKSVVEQMLAGFGGVARGFESEIIPTAIGRTAQRLELPPLRDPWYLDEDAMVPLRSELQRLIDQRARGANWLTLTSPANIFHVGIIARLFPRAPIVFLGRDRRDLALRIHATHYGQGHPFSSDLKALYRHLDWHDAMVAAWSRRLGASAWHLQYESIGTTQAALLARFADYLGVAAGAPIAFSSDEGVSVPYHERMAQALR
jgi:hypothetical protein